MHGIGAEQPAFALSVDADRPGRMAGRVEDVKRATAEIENIAVPNDLREWAGFDQKGMRIDRRSVRCEVQVVDPRSSLCRIWTGIRENLCLCLMAVSSSDKMEGTDVVRMAVWLLLR